MTVARIGAAKPKSTAEKLAHRAECIEQIEELLKHGAKTSTEISTALGLHPSSGFAYLYHMEQVLRLARKSGQFKGRAVMWELGADPLLADADAPDLNGGPRRRTVPAKQCGMWRDAMVSALFGAPAQGAPAC